MNTTVKQLSEMKKRNLITADEAAEIIGVSRSTLLRYAKDGTLKDVKIGGRIYYRADDVRNYLMGGQ